MLNYEERATAYAEAYGIIDYTIKGQHMIYYADHIDYIGQKTPTTYKATVNLKTLEETRKALKKHNKRGSYNRGK